ncbi:MAG: CoA-binding protein [Candidatus Lokiarchaeota archaeon]|nr:CoA-binding protein [Candidatus Lokiarchaeota archaeon]
MTDNSLDPLFYPRSVAIVYASNRFKFFITGLVSQNYNLENLYLVTSKKDELFGQKCYKTIDDIPLNELDLVIVAIRTEELVEKLKYILSKKKVKFFHIFTAGMGETGEAGENLEREIKNLIKKEGNGARVLGPNCMGVYCPSGGVSYNPNFPNKSGPIGLIYQSGDLHTKTIVFGEARHDLKFSKGASVGNCLDLQISDFLKYLNDDAQTKVICVYLEGFTKLHPREGRRLYHVLKAMKKPVLFMKGGRTKRSQIAAVTHTGAIVSDHKIWDAIFKQTPTIDVPPSLDDMIDYTYLFHELIKNRENDKIYPRGKSVLVIVWSGGFGILAADIITQSGLDLPYFEGETLKKLQDIHQLKVGSLNNPLDLPWMVYTDAYRNIAKAAITDEIDLVIIESDSWRNIQDPEFQWYYENILKIKKHIEKLGKILIITLPEYPSENRTRFYQNLVNDGFIVFPSMKRAAQAFIALYNYGKKRNI